MRKGLHSWRGVRGTWGQCCSCLNNILQNVAHTTYQKPSPIGPAISSPSCTTETDRSTGSSMLQTPHCGKGWAGQAACRLIWLGRQSWVQSHRDISASHQRRPQASVPKPVEQPLHAGSGPGHDIGLMVVELPSVSRCPPTTQAVTWAQTFDEHLLHARHCVNYCEQQNNESTVPTLSKFTV